MGEWVHVLQVSNEGQSKEDMRMEAYSDSCFQAELGSSHSY